MNQKFSLFSRLFPPSDRRVTRDRVGFLLLTPLLCATSFWNSLYTSGCVLKVDGAELACLSSQEEAEAAVTAAEAWASEFLDGPSNLTSRVEMEQVRTRKNELADPEEAQDLLQERVEGLVDVWEVTLDGERVGAVEDGSSLNDLLGEIWGPYLTADTLEAGFEPEVKVTRTLAAEGSAEGLDAIRAALTANRVGETIYTVQPGDSVIGICNAHGIKRTELEQLNPEKDLSVILVGEELVVKAPTPLLSVRTVDRRSYIDHIPIQTVRRKTDELFVGEEDLSNPGKEGWGHYVAEMTFLNGEEQTRNVESMDTIIPSEDALVLVGTKEPPAAEATGEFQWPVQGHITSYFGLRFLFGQNGFHSGLDVGAPNGSRIRAADGGVVTFAGEGTGVNETLGNYVCINHGNGYQTIYGHCSVLEVEEGEQVYPGQTIARVGSTGRSTGNHLHLMVKKDGVNIDPLTVLP